jgi:hypothetical protein
MRTISLPNVGSPDSPTPERKTAENVSASNQLCDVTASGLNIVSAPGSRCWSCFNLTDVDFERRAG